MAGFSRLRGIEQPPDLRDRLGLVVDTLGERFLDWSSKRVRSDTVVPVWQHPLGACVEVAGPHQLAILLELASWFESLRSTPGFRSALEVLKSSWDTARLQFAVAARLQQLGLLEALEPPAGRGRVADLAFVVERRRYLAECYVPEEPPRGTSGWFTHELAAIFAAAPRDRFTRVDLLFTRPIGRRDCRRLRDVIEQRLREPTQRGLIVDEAAEIYVKYAPFEEAAAMVRARTPKGDGQPDWAAMNSIARAHELDSVRSYAAIPKAPLTMVTGRNAPSEADANDEAERADYLVEKLARKIFQTKGNEGEGRVLISRVPELAWSTPRAARILDVVERRLRGKRQGFAALILGMDHAKTNPPRIEWSWRCSLGAQQEAGLSETLSQLKTTES